MAIAPDCQWNLGPIGLAVWSLPPQGGSEGPNLHLSHATAGLPPMLRDTSPSSAKSHQAPFSVRGTLGVLDSLAPELRHLRQFVATGAPQQQHSPAVITTRCVDASSTFHRVRSVRVASRPYWTEVRSFVSSPQLAQRSRNISLPCSLQEGLAHCRRVVTLSRCICCVFVYVRYRTSPA